MVNNVENVSFILFKPFIILGGSETSYSRHLVLLGEKLGVRWVRMLELSSKDCWDTQKYQTLCFSCSNAYVDAIHSGF